MNEKVRKHVESLFSDIPESRQLQELKEEVCANLNERINDFIGDGMEEEEAFKKALADLGDVSELAESMRRASNTKFSESMFRRQPMDKKHVFGYVSASGILLFGILSAAVTYLQQGNLFFGISALLPFVIVSSALFIYFGLTQETPYQYGMSSKRALAYSLAGVLTLFGVMTAGMLYYMGRELFIVVSVLIPFVVPGVILFIYLVLTETSREKIDEEWARGWMEKWNAEWKRNYELQHGAVRGGISGALWLFSIAIFLLVGFNGGWKYSWIVFIFACGVEALIEAVMAYKGRA